MNFWPDKLKDFPYWTAGGRGIVGLLLPYIFTACFDYWKDKFFVWSSSNKGFVWKHLGTKNSIKTEDRVVEREEQIGKKSCTMK